MPRINAQTVVEHRENQRKELIAAAISILEKSGVEAVNFGSVADKAGLARPSVYEYFKSKSDLLFAIAEDQFPAWLKQVEASVQKAKTPEEKFEAFFSSQIKMLISGEHAFAFELVSELDEKAKTKVHGLHLSLFELTREPLEKMGVTPSAEAFQLISGVLHSAIGMASGPKAKHQKLAEMAATFVLGGFKALLSTRK